MNNLQFPVQKYSGSTTRMARQKITSHYHVVLIITLSKYVKLILNRISTLQNILTVQKREQNVKVEEKRRQ